MRTDEIPRDVESLLDRLVGPDAAFVAELAASARLQRPVMIDSTSAAGSVRPYTWLLSRIGQDGIRLTSAGYLPPRVVTDAITSLGWEDRWVGACNRENQTLPVLELRQSARRLGLVRVYRKVLLRTALGARLRADPGGLWWHIAGRLPVAHNEAEHDAGVLLLLAVAAGAPISSEVIGDLVRRGMGALGWRDAQTLGPLDDWQAFGAARETWEDLRRLGAIPEPRFGQPPMPPAPVGIALARAALRDLAT
jgi:hypothetical protein